MWCFGTRWAEIVYWFSGGNERMGIWVGIIGEHTVECLSAVHEYMTVADGERPFPRSEAHPIHSVQAWRCAAFLLC